MGIPATGTTDLSNVGIYVKIVIHKGGSNRMAQAEVLIVEDDEDIREGIRILLNSEGYHVIEACNGMEGLKLLSDDIDLVILDVMMPGISGLRVCEEIRKSSVVPILFLTAKAQESDKLIGLMAGGDDYLAKPFSYAELLARITSLLRRYRVYGGRNSSDESKNEWIEHLGIRLNRLQNQVTRDGEDIELTDIEYNILRLLMEYPQKIFSVHNIYESVWEEPFIYSSGNTVMVHIRKLRIKLEDNPENPVYIQTVWGKGYRLGKNTTK